MSVTSDLTSGEQRIRDICLWARQAAQTLATLPTARLDVMLDEIAAALDKDKDAIFAANAKDIAAAEQAGLSKAMVDRLRITEKTLASMVKGVRQVRALPQPLGQKMAEWTRPNGIAISKIRVPIGVIAIIYESRPNVTIDAAVLCLKTGNATILRGGKEAIHSNRALIAALAHCASLPKGAVQLIDNTDRALIPFLCRQSDTIDLIIPRGGHGLIETVVAEARIPVIKHANGVCSVFVHAKADLDMAEKVILNAKTQRPGVCNAIETLLIDRAVADKFVPRIAAALDQGRRRNPRRRDRAQARLRRQHQARDREPTGAPSTSTSSSPCASWTASTRRSPISPVRLASQRRHHHHRHRRRRALPQRSRLRHRLLERLHALHRRRRIRLRRGDRHQHRQTPRPRPHGPRRTHQLQVRHPRLRADQDVIPGSRRAPRDGRRKPLFKSSVILVCDRWGKIAAPAAITRSAPRCLRWPAGHRRRAVARLCHPGAVKRVAQLNPSRPFG